jgi:carbon monoxide dehydrogenase subunit G
MRLEHGFTVPVPVEEAWEVLLDLPRVAPCMPGATLTGVDGDTFTGTVKVKLGPISMQYAGTGIWKERDEASGRAVIEARGKDKRGNGTASALVTAQLSADGSGTAVSVDTDLTVTGKPAQFGRGVMQDVSDKLLDQFVACLSEKLGSSDQTTGARGEADPVTVPPSVTDEAAVMSEPVAPLSGTETTTRTEPAASPRHASTTDASAPTEIQLDLLSTVLPVLAKRYAAPALGVLVALLVLLRLRRRSR